MYRQPLTLIHRVAIGTLAIVLISLAGLRTAHAVEIVPSIGLSQATDGSDSRMMVGLALRNGLLPRIQTEIQAGHRSEDFEFAGQNLTMRTIPVTLSLWASPVPMLYAGGGVGAYFQGVEYENNLFPATNETKFGAHLGGGFRFSMTPLVGLDFQGRYVFLEKQSTSLASGDFDPSFWTISAGLAVGF